MPTVNQLVRKGRRQPKHKTKAPARESNPQKKGVCVRVYTTTPKKPNSAWRQVAEVRASHGREVVAYSTGEGHTLQDHSAGPVRGGSATVRRGVKYHITRGKYDTAGVEGRAQSRSKYGAKSPQK